MKKNLLVIFGGRSCEHDVSIISGLQAAEAADRNKYDVHIAYVDREGQWHVGDPLKEISFYRNFKADQVTHVQPMGEESKLLLIRYPKDGKKLFASGREVLIRADVVMPVFHGLNGEDGSIQGFLELANVPYTSSGILGSAVGMDKILMRQVLSGAGVPILPGLGFSRERWNDDRDGVLREVETALQYPMYVKPANLGSSIGISRADDQEGLARALDVAAAYDRRLLVERGLEKFKEVNCSVLGYGERARASVLEMPVSWEKFLTFDDKYMRGGKGSGESQGMESLKRQIPAPISEALTERIQRMSVEVFKLLDLKGVVRIDYMIDEESGEVFLGEVNTIPGSLAFYLWQASGLTFSEMLDEMVKYAGAAWSEKNASVFAYESQILNKPGGKGGKMA